MYSPSLVRLDLRASSYHSSDVAKSSPDRPVARLGIAGENSLRVVKYFLRWESHTKVHYCNGNFVSLGAAALLPLGYGLTPIRVV